MKNSEKEEISNVALISIFGVLTFLIVLLEVSLIPEGTDGVLTKQEYTVEYEQSTMVEDVPENIFIDPPVVKEVVLATPEPLTTEEQEPEMTYLGEYTLTAYVATGNPCADGVYPQVGWTCACNDPNLWHKTIFITGYGTRYVHDTGGMPSNTIIDLFVGSLDEAYNIGRRKVEVYIINDNE